MTKDLMYRTKESVVLREESDNWALLFDADTSSIVGLNPIGVCVWRMLEQNKTTLEIMDFITASYDNVTSHLSDDVIAFISDLAARGFLIPAGK